MHDGDTQPIPRVTGGSRHARGDEPVEGGRRHGDADDWPLESDGGRRAGPADPRAGRSHGDELIDGSRRTRSGDAGRRAGQRRGDREPTTDGDASDEWFGIDGARRPGHGGADHEGGWAHGDDRPFDDDDLRHPGRGGADRDGEWGHGDDRPFDDDLRHPRRADDREGRSYSDELIDGSRRTRSGEAGRRAGQRRGDREPTADAGDGWFGGDGARHPGHDGADHEGGGDGRPLDGADDLRHPRRGGRRAKRDRDEHARGGADQLIEGDRHPMRGRQAGWDGGDEHQHPRRRAGRGRGDREPSDSDEVLLAGHHRHSHVPAEPASRRVRVLLAALLVPFALAALIGAVLLYPFGGQPDTRSGAGTPVHGTITAVRSGACNTDVQVGEQADRCLIVTVRMADGAAPNEQIRAVVPLEPSTPKFSVDDDVVLSYGGGDPRAGESYQLVDFQRELPLALLAGLFAIAVLVLGRWQGLKALVALGISFAVLVLFVLPAIIAGENPLLVGITGAGLIMFVVLYLTHGLSARTSTAVLGTMVSLALIGGLGALWAPLAKLTGLDEDTATLVTLLDQPIDTRGLLLAGVVIGALGVLDDVTVTQTSAVWELRAANPKLSYRQLYAAALRIGRDHVASAVNTLVMAYAGAALPLLLFSSISGAGLTNILSSQSIAQEIVRTLVGSIGLVAAVPVTTALAVAVATREAVSPGSPRNA